MKKLRRLAGAERGKDFASLLDYGAGLGRWSRAAHVAGFCVTAYDPSIARQSPGTYGVVPVHRIERLHGRSFDAINVEQVLEHVADPLEVLQQIRSLCHARTVIRITVPNMHRCTEGRQIWNEWPFNGSTMHTMAPYEHLHGFTPASLNALVARARFEAVPSPRLLRADCTYVVRKALGAALPILRQTKVFVMKSV